MKKIKKINRGDYKKIILYLWDFQDVDEYVDDIKVILNKQGEKLQSLKMIYKYAYNSNKIINESDVLFVELGDTYRLDLYKPYLNENTYAKMESKIHKNNRHNKILLLIFSS